MTDEVYVQIPGHAQIPFWVLDVLGIERRDFVAIFVYGKLFSLGSFTDKTQPVNSATWRQVREISGLSKSTVLRCMSLLYEVGAIYRDGDLIHMPQDFPQWSASTDEESVSTDRRVREYGPSPYTHSSSEKDICVEEENEKSFTNPKYARKEYSEDFATLWNDYPRKVEKAKAYKAYNASLRRGVSHGDLAAATSAYAIKIIREQTDDRYVKHPATFWGPDEPWRDHLPSVQQTADDALADPATLAAAIEWESYSLAAAKAFQEHQAVELPKPSTQYPPKHPTLPPHPQLGIYFLARDGSGYLVNGQNQVIYHRSTP